MMTRRLTPANRCTTALLLTFALALAGCASNAPPSAGRSTAGTSGASPKAGATGPAPSARPGAYYKDVGPAANVPEGLDRVPDAAPRVETLHRFANRPYNVFGVDYAPLSSLAPLHQRGVASWYGRKFHGQKTAIGEPYDMFAMTAAHPTAPLPSFARVTAVASGRSVIVRLNDRGPFHAGRIIDLSYAAAHRLGIAQGGSGEVDFELLLPPFAASTSVAAAPTPPPAAALVEPPPLPAGTTVDAAREAFYVQLGAFGNFANAETFQQRMNSELATAPRVQQIDALYRVRLGPFATREAAIAARDRAQSILATSLPIVSGPSR